MSEVQQLKATIRRLDKAIAERPTNRALQHLISSMEIMSWGASESRRRVNLAIACGCGLIFASCTVTPHQVVSHSPSLDGTNRNSGFFGFRSDGYGMLTEHAKQRYDALVRRYGSEMTVPVREGDGLSRTNESSVWIIDPEHLADFEELTRRSISP